MIKPMKSSVCWKVNELVGSSVDIHHVAESTIRVIIDLIFQLQNNVPGVFRRTTKRLNN